MPDLRIRFRHWRSLGLTAIVAIQLARLEARFRIAVIPHPEHTLPEDGPAPCELMPGSLSPWRWCCVEVRAMHRITGIEASVFLGRCSFRDEAHFVAAGCFVPLVQETVSEIADQHDLLRRVLVQEAVNSL